MIRLISCGLESDACGSARGAGAGDGSGVGDVVRTNCTTGWLLRSHGHSRGAAVTGIAAGDGDLGYGYWQDSDYDTDRPGLWLEEML